MGLFSGLAKLAGKVVKTGLSVTTGGKSDAVLKIAKKVIGVVKPKAKPAPTTADLVDVLNYQPNVTSGYGTFVDGAGSAMPGLKKTVAKKAKKAPAKKAPAKKAKKAPAKKPAAKRAPPKGGLDFAALSRSWNAAGKPVSWQQWIKRKGGK